MPREENGFERRARLGQADFERRAGGRPFNRIAESWWWFALVSSQFWLRLGAWPFQDHRRRFDNGYALFSLIFVVTLTPTFAWSRRRARRKRLEQTKPNETSSPAT